MAAAPDSARRIRATYDRVLAEGLRSDSISGASRDQIDAMAAAQRVASLPAALREVYGLIGARSGLWLAGSSFGTAMDGRTVKSHALASLGRLPNPFADAPGMYALVSHQASAFHVLDGADLDVDDPPVWLVAEEEAVIQAWDTVSAWFAATAPDVARYRERLEIMLELGDDPPRWAVHLRTS